MNSSRIAHVIINQSVFIKRLTLLKIKLVDFGLACKIENTDMSKVKIGFFVTLFLTVSLFAQSGKKAPAFKCIDENGKVHQLKDYKGKKVILYFYPKDLSGP